MKADIQIKADILKAAMSEDRTEIRDIRSSIYNTISLLTVSSFAITAFFLEKGALPRACGICLLTDVLITAVLWVFFIMRKLDLYHCRQALAAREVLIKRLDQQDKTDLDPFPDTSTIVPNIRDGELWWWAGLATFVICLKAVIIRYL